MVQLFAFALLLAAPALASMIGDGFNEIDSREYDELDSRKLHFHISAKSLFHDVEKYGGKAAQLGLKYGTKIAGNTKYGKYLKYLPKAAKLAKFVARDDFDDYDFLTARDMDLVDELEELLARAHTDTSVRNFAAREFEDPLEFVERGFYDDDEDGLLTRDYEEFGPLDELD